MPDQAISDDQFPLHRGVTPMLWVFAALLLIELIVIELVMAGRWPNLRWFLIGSSLVTLIWLIRWIRSFRRLPHRIEGENLVLSYGSLKHLDVPLASIKAVRGNFSSEELREPGVRSFVPMAYPNRLIEVDPPLPGRKRPYRAVAVRFDDPEAFDLALKAHGIGFLA